MSKRLVTFYIFLSVLAQLKHRNCMKIFLVQLTILNFYNKSYFGVKGRRLMFHFHLLPAGVFVRYLEYLRATALMWIVIVIWSLWCFAMAFHNKSKNLYCFSSREVKVWKDGDLVLILCSFELVSLASFWLDLINLEKVISLQLVLRISTNVRHHTIIL